MVSRLSSRSANFRSALCRSAGVALVLASLTPVTAFADAVDDGSKAFAKGDYATAMKIWRPLAEQGVARAEFNLGFLYAQGSGTSQDMKEAVTWWAKAADHGLVEADQNLGEVYSDGDHLPKDDKEAAKWYTKGAQLGDGQSAGALGDMYASGRGVPKDYNKAITLYKTAIAKGYAPAFKSFGVLYESGQGVPKDSIKAHMYFNVAAAISSGDVAAQATNLRNTVAANMSPADVAKARALAHDCMSSNYAKCN